MGFTMSSCASLCERTFGMWWRGVVAEHATHGHSRASWILLMDDGVETVLGKYECERVGGERSDGVKGRHVQQMGASGDTVMWRHPLLSSHLRNRMWFTFTSAAKTPCASRDSAGVQKSVNRSRPRFIQRQHVAFTDTTSRRFVMKLECNMWMVTWTALGVGFKSKLFKGIFWCKFNSWSITPWNCVRLPLQRSS